MPHRRSHHSSGHDPQHNPPDNSQAHGQNTPEESIPLRFSTHATGANPRPAESTSSSAAPRWEQRHRAPSQREPLQRETLRRDLPQESHARRHQSSREFRWSAPSGAEWGTSQTTPPESEVPLLEAPVPPVPHEDSPPQSQQWSQSDLEELARETMAGRGRKLSRRRARRLAARAQRRHLKARKAQAQPKRKRAPLWRLFRAIAFTLCLVALFELGVAALTSPRFAVQEVSSDTVQVVPEAIIEEAKSSLLGQNFFRADTASGVEMLSQLPPVQSVSIQRQLDWPPRMHLSVVERQPFARVEGESKEWFVVDREGMPFRPATPEDEKLYTVCSKALKPEIGQKLEMKHWAPVVEFAQTLQQDTEQGHDWALRAIYFDEHGFASLRLAETGASQDRMLVHLGTGPWDKKLQRTRQALTWLQAKGVQAESLNLISAKRPVWTPRPPKLEENPSETNASSGDKPA